MEKKQKLNNGSKLVMGTFEYVGMDTERCLHFYVKKDNFRAIERMIRELKPMEGQEVDIIVKPRRTVQ